jgi:hypothetical protein
MAHGGPPGGRPLPASRTMQKARFSVGNPIGNFFPIIGKLPKNFSNHWKKWPEFSNHWKKSFQSLEKWAGIFQPLEKSFPIIGKFPGRTRGSASLPVESATGGRCGFQPRRWM